MLTNSLRRTMPPLAALAALALALTGCGPDNNEQPASNGKGTGTYADPFPLKSPADATVAGYLNDRIQVSVTPVSVVKGDKAEVEKLGIGLLAGKTPYYVTATYTHKGGPEDIGAYAAKLSLHSDAEHAYQNAPAWGADFPPCQEGSDAALKLTPGKTVTTCEIFLVPETVQPVFVAYKGDEKAAAEVVWKIG
ncbi:hypothetical protein OG535_27130 [Kitasatospora sp. NBC_00085]|uniref:hypothetical protein n=1 Tax=unclassified Kitasatospora TaxID=2633591 RepID=UPI00324D5770